MCLFYEKKTKHFLINIGTGKDFTIKYYLNQITKVILEDKKVKIKFDKSKPNGVKRKVMDVSLARKYGWKHKINLKTSIKITYQAFLKELI